MSIHLDSDTLAPYCVGFFLLVFVVLLIIALRLNNKRKKQLTSVANQFNFSPLAALPPEIMEALKTLYIPSRVTQIKNIYSHLFGDETYYLLDIYSRSSAFSNEENMETASLAVHSPHLDLPNFLLYYRVQAPGKLGGWIDSLVQNAMMQSALRSYQDVPPDFDLKYGLYTPDIEAAARFFTPELLSQIASIDGIYARGQGSLLVLTNQAVQKGGALDEASFTQYLQNARALCDLFAR